MPRTTRATTTTADPATSREELLSALLVATRAMVALAARSLAGLAGDVTLPQYRVLVILATRGPQRVVDIATELGVSPSTATRMCERLVRKALVRKRRSTTDRREIHLTLTAAGRRLVQAVTDRRRSELSELVDQMPAAWTGPLTAGLHALAQHTGELPESRWFLTTGTAPADSAEADLAGAPAEAP